MSEKYVKRSPVTGKKYDYFSKDIVHLINLQQISFYIEDYGVMPVDIYISDDRKRPGKKVVIYCFEKSECAEAFDAWCKRGKDGNNELVNDDVNSCEE